MLQDTDRYVKRVKVIGRADRTGFWMTIPIKLARGMRLKKGDYVDVVAYSFNRFYVRKSNLEGESNGSN